jgi:hypothetical protein
VKTSKVTIAAIGFAAAIAAYFMFRKKAQAGALPAGDPLISPPVPEVTVPELTLTSEAVAEAATIALPGRTSESTIEAANKPYDGQAAIDAYLRERAASATRDASKTQMVVTPQATLTEALAKVGSAASPVTNLLSADTNAVKARREAYRGVIRAAADLLQKAGVTGSGCGILDASRALSLDPFGMAVDKMAGVVDTIEQKVSKVISTERKDATYATISAMSDPIAICFALTVQLTTASADVVRANTQGTATPSSTVSLVGRRIADALKVSCQAATAPSASTSIPVATFDAGKVASTTSSFTPKPTLKTGFL